MNDETSPRKVFRQPALADVWPDAVALPAHEQRALAVLVHLFVGQQAKRRRQWPSDAWPALRLIRLVFLVDWDPIGVFEHLGADDEYDGYVSGFYELLRGGASEEILADYLRDIEENAMRLNQREPYLTQRAARRLETVRKIQMRYTALTADRK